jgi:protein-tyrosine phosphatase
MAIKVLFVCLGNICRSPMAEGIFQKRIEEEGLSVQISADSAGTSNYHSGELADIRMRKTAIKNQIELTHRARQIKGTDLLHFDYVLAMDKSNLADILKLHHQPTAQIELLRAFGPKTDDLNVPDPYYSDDHAFDEVFQILEFHIDHFIHHIRETNEL